MPSRCGFLQIHQYSVLSSERTVFWIKVESVYDSLKKHFKNSKNQPQKHKFADQCLNPTNCKRYSEIEVQDPARFEELSKKCKAKIEKEMERIEDNRYELFCYKRNMPRGPIVTEVHTAEEVSDSSSDYTSDEELAKQAKHR